MHRDKAYISTVGFLMILFFLLKYNLYLNVGDLVSNPHNNIASLVIQWDNEQRVFVGWLVGDFHVPTCFVSYFELQKEICLRLLDVSIF